MPLAGTSDALGDLIRTKIDALSDAEKADREKVFREMGAAIIEHLTGSAGANAVQITSQPVTVTNVTGVLAGAATSGPGTGTCSGTGNLV